MLNFELDLNFYFGMLDVAFFVVSCAKPSYVINLNPPMSSYVKIHNTIEIKGCKGELPDSLKECPVGVFGSTGSGMAIAVVHGESIVITAGHVCTPSVADFIGEHENSTKIQDHQGIWHQAHLIKSSLDNAIGTPDMCALWVPSLNVKQVMISHRAPRIGEMIYYIGSPAGIYHPPTAPVLTGIYSGPVDASSSMVTAPSVGGSSGSIILDVNNRMLGVLYATHPKFHNVTIITSHKSTMMFLREIRRTFKNGRKDN